MAISGNQLYLRADGQTRAWGQKDQGIWVGSRDSGYLLPNYCILSFPSVCISLGPISSFHGLNPSLQSIRSSVNPPERNLEVNLGEGKALWSRGSGWWDPPRTRRTSDFLPSRAPKRDRLIIRAIRIRIFRSWTYPRIRLENLLIRIAWFHNCPADSLLNFNFPKTMA
jgi:hypothetical protein